ncbi:tyrosine-protein phosphatase non-receptor type 9 isoform X1 [Bradysia coprophila]|uniref:tyrosine-protein phosphatase non-receptor type 9 isoform X1 n=1 Tax=Bradysia coprophila TaxID=38358 RepID=UPI00187DAE88|nr:tyrosine-protein phosphatase non-receptor type 9 isoform X1 [Bradysia coprophila]
MCDSHMKRVFHFCVLCTLQAVKQFIDLVNELGSNVNRKNVTTATAVKFLFARKFDVQRAVALYEQHELIRQRECLYNLDPMSDPLRTELETGKFTILPGRDVSGAAIALFSANLHSPLTVTHKTTLQGVVYQLDIALQNVETQSKGLIFIYDMSSSKYSNFDYDLSQKILTLLKGGYPARLKKVLIVSSPLWFKAPFKILRLFVREKLRERVFTVSVPQLSLHVPRESLPIHLGGSLKINHSTWLAHCHKSMTNREDELLANIGQPAGPQVSNDYVCEATNQQQLNNHQDGNQLSEFYSENPPSSASSGFSDDDSLAGAEGDPKTIEQIVDMVRSRGRQGLVQEYAEIRARAPEGTFTNARIRVNLAKNRYTDVLCYDHSRVILSQMDDEPTSDYINANFVDGYKQRNAYISTQGPLPKTTPDFWRMVWEQHCLVIVMTTRVLERGRTKCGQYWETDEGGEWEHGSFRVRTISVESNEEYTVSTLELTNSKTDESRIVSHWQFTSWPDYGVPSSAMAMLNFLQRVREQQAKMVKDMDDTWAGHGRGPPIIVHCSAGIGRTGTFITLDICISRLEDVGTADIRGTVEKIRSQRAYSIQMPDQYVFCHLAFIEYALSRGMLQSADLSGFDEREEDSE